MRGDLAAARALTRKLTWINNSVAISPCSPGTLFRHFSARSVDHGELLLRLAVADGGDSGEVGEGLLVCGDDGSVVGAGGGGDE